MATTANGWSVIEESGCAPLTVAGVPIVRGVRKGDVWTVMRWVAQQFHERVEPLKSPGCWGYNKRKIGNTDTWSEHAAGCAMDLNAPQHNQGDDPTPGPGGGYTVKQVAEIHAIERESGGAVEWGGDWGNPDGMHFQAGRDKAAVARFAKQIRETNMAVELTDASEKSVAAETAGKLGTDLAPQNRESGVAKGLRTNVREVVDAALEELVPVLVAAIGQKVEEILARPDEDGT